MHAVHVLVRDHALRPPRRLCVHEALRRVHERAIEESWPVERVVEAERRLVREAEREQN